MSFSESSEIKLINIVAKHSVLYDTVHPHYRNNHVKEEVWNTIGKELNRNGDDCRKTWKLIRDGYIRYKRRNGTLDRRSAPRNSKAKRHRHLSFLDNILRYKAGRLHIPPSPKEDADDEQNVANNELNFEEQESTDVNFAFKSENHTSDEATETVQAVYIDVQPEEQMESDLKVNHLKRHSRVKLKPRKQRDEKRQALVKSIVKRKDDDVEFFCRHIAEVLRNLPPVEKAEAKKHLNAVLSDYEIMAARYTSERRSSSSFS